MTMMMNRTLLLFITDRATPQHSVNGNIQGRYRKQRILTPSSCLTNCKSYGKHHACETNIYGEFGAKPSTAFLFKCVRSLCDFYLRL